jgi:hypothetical protein
MKSLGPDIREDRQQTELSNAGSNIQIHGNQRQIHSLLQAVSCYPRTRLPLGATHNSFVLVLVLRAVD